MAKLNISAVLLATIGGFGSIFSILISPQIRAYNRMSLFIAEYYSDQSFVQQIEGLVWSNHRLLFYKFDE